MSDSLFAHPTLPATYDRGQVKTDFAQVVWPEGVFLQGADLNEAQTILRRRGQRISDLITRDGDRIEGCDIILLHAGTGQFRLTAGKVYAKGDVRLVDEKLVTGVPMTGDIRVGVRLASTTVTHVNDPDLMGLHEGSEAEGEPGAAREVETVEWGYEGDGGAGALYSVYLLKDGVPLDQTPPPNLSGVNAAIALYDRGAHGHYVVRGCEVAALGVSAGKQIFSIGRGEANIMGFKRVREYDLRHEETEAPDTEEIEAESRTYVGGASFIFDTYHRPISSVVSVTVEKQKTVTVTKGALTGSQDALPDPSVISLVSVVQGPTTYVAGADYVLTADKVDWSPSGAEPSGGSSYSVTYRYYDSVPLGTGYTFTPTSITVFGGAANGNTILRYTRKMPRTDLLCLDESGMAVYVKGISARQNPVAPITPSTLLKLAEVRNSWLDKPVIVQAGIRSIPFAELWRYMNFFFGAVDLLAIERLKSGIDSREPVLKKGVFTDPFTSDFYRDAGVVQSAAIFDGEMRLAIDPTVYRLPISSPIMLDFTDEIVLRQELVSFCMKINPYQAFDRLPGELDLSPSSDFWTEFSTQWLSPVTRTVATGSSGTADRVEGRALQALPMLRQIPIAFTVRGFLANEILQVLTFDGVSVEPPGVQQANAQGVITGSFTIPANIAAGVKRVFAQGSAGSKAETLFEGRGNLDISVRRQITTVVRPVTTSERRDPLAQTFVLTEGRFLTGINLRFCAKGVNGNGVLVELVTVENGIPTSDVVAQAVVGMTSVVLNTWHSCRFPAPVWVPADVEMAFVIKTDDAIHAVSAGRIGDADETTGKRIAAQPYAVGVMLSSSNARTWTPHQSEDIAFQLVAAKFAPATKTFNFGTLSVTDMSDILVAAAVEIPTADANLYFELQRQSGEVIKIAPGQPLEFTDYITESMPFRAILTGTEKVTPVLWPELQVIAGKIRTQGNYVTRAMAMGTAIRLSSVFKSFLPSGSSVTVECDAADNNWQAMTLGDVFALDMGWQENKYTRDPHTAQQGRLRITFNGGPAARPRFADMTAVVV